MKKQLKQLLEFHEAYGVPFHKEPTIPAQDRIELRIKLQREELEELVEAIKDGDMVEIADALCDSLYILLGTVHEFGLGTLFEDMFDEVQRSNMSKLDENGKPIIREDGKVLKSHLFSEPNLQQFLDNRIKFKEMFVSMFENPHYGKHPRLDLPKDYHQDHSL